MAQQTVVDWLIEHLMKLDKELDGRRKNEDATVLKLNPIKIYKQAKQIEKEQKIEFAKQCLNKALDTDIRTAYKNVEQYYNETYGTE